MGRASSALKLSVAAMSIAAAQPARAETVYEFIVQCHEDNLGPCYSRIRERLKQAKAKGNGRGFCLPPAWGMPDYLSSGFPISLIEHIRLSLSAGRFGDADQPVDDAITGILKTLYPCD